MMILPVLALWPGRQQPRQRAYRWTIWLKSIVYPLNKIPRSIVDFGLPTFVGECCDGGQCLFVFSNLMHRIKEPVFGTACFKGFYDRNEIHRQNLSCTNRVFGNVKASVEMPGITKMAVIDTVGVLNKGVYNLKVAEIPLSVNEPVRRIPIGGIIWRMATMKPGNMDRMASFGNPGALVTSQAARKAAWRTWVGWSGPIA
ncbi:hypothetical protein BV22DRAFT_1048650 [Leucogyrophana mollusca]|uniref:Uncharacterized protein n=1 Tax=Leucogyrophana mollusca TaxID=85980 RepID=A0ACB8BBV6_9AGAM|nr:hypothetical protein BV22DRAFT_1048650 [Leucogyrophana mollusca]